MKKTAILLTIAALVTGGIASAEGNPSGQQGQMSYSKKDPQMVRDVQQQLSQRGHSPGDIDGKWGSKTQNALKDFQRSQNIQADGKLNQQTAQALGLEESARARYGGEKQQQPQQQQQHQQK